MGEKTVEKTGPPAEASALRIEGQTGKDDDGNVRGGNRRVGERFANAEGPPSQGRG